MSSAKKFRIKFISTLLMVSLSFGTIGFTQNTIGYTEHSTQFAGGKIVCASDFDTREEFEAALEKAMYDMLSALGSGGLRSVISNSHFHTVGDGEIVCVSDFDTREEFEAALEKVLYDMLSALGSGGLRSVICSSHFHTVDDGEIVCVSDFDTQEEFEAALEKALYDMLSPLSTCPHPGGHFLERRNMRYSTQGTTMSFCAQLTIWWDELCWRLNGPFCGRLVNTGTTVDTILHTPVGHPGTLRIYCSSCRFRFN